MRPVPTAARAQPLSRAAATKLLAHNDVYEPERAGTRLVTRRCRSGNHGHAFGTALGAAGKAARLEHLEPL